MDPALNPYAPGAGTPPPELAGRSDVLEAARVALLRTSRRRPVQSLILVGLRGVGKTVLLNRIRLDAEDAHVRPIMIEAHEGKTLPQLLVPALRSAATSLSFVEQARAQFSRLLKVLKGFAGAVKVTIEDVEFGIDPEIGTADSGDLEHDLPQLFTAMGELAAAADRPLVLLIDELQYLSQTEFSALIMAVHQVNQRGLPIIVIAAGLPQILGLAGNAKSYAERLFRYPEVGPLSAEDAARAIEEPARKEGVAFDRQATAEILKVTERYPYFLQQWAYEAWNVANASPISADVVSRATECAIAELDQSFFKVRFDRCTPSEKRYMRALAELGVGGQKSGDIAEMLGLKTTSVAPTRSNLIRKGMIYSPAHGITEFTVPMFDQYMRRAMPDGV